MPDLPHVGPSEPVTVPAAPAITNNDDQPFTAKPFAPLVGFLELGESEVTPKVQEQLNEIWEYLGGESKSDVGLERLHALRLLENKLSPPRIGQSRLYKVHSYIRASRLVKQAEMQRDAHLKGL